MFFISSIYRHIYILYTRSHFKYTIAVVIVYIYIYTHNTLTHYIHGYGSNMRYIILRENVYWPVTRDGNAFFGSCSIIHTHTRIPARTHNANTRTRKRVEKKNYNNIYIRKPVYVYLLIIIYI